MVAPAIGTGALGARQRAKHQSSTGRGQTTRYHCQYPLESETTQRGLIVNFCWVIPSFYQEGKDRDKDVE
jgi:hypothetical protein